MRIKKSSSYALHALIYMSKHRNQLPVTTRTIAKSEGIPVEYLAKVFQVLVKAGFVKSAKAKKKGYVFVKPINEIHILEILEAVEGEELFKKCFMQHCKCEGTPDNCRIYLVWRNCTKKIIKLLREITLDDATWDHPEHRFYFNLESKIM